MIKLHFETLILYAYFTKIKEAGKEIKKERKLTNPFGKQEQPNCFFHFVLKDVILVYEP